MSSATGKVIFPTTLTPAKFSTLVAKKSSLRSLLFSVPGAVPVLADPPAVPDPGFAVAADVTPVGLAAAVVAELLVVTAPASLFKPAAVALSV